MFLSEIIKTPIKFFFTCGQSLIHFDKIKGLKETSGLYFRLHSKKSVGKRYYSSKELKG